MELLFLCVSRHLLRQVVAAEETRVRGEKALMFDHSMWTHPVVLESTMWYARWVLSKFTASFDWVANLLPYVVFERGVRSKMDHFCSVFRLRQITRISLVSLTHTTRKSLENQRSNTNSIVTKTRTPTLEHRYLSAASHQLRCSTTSRTIHCNCLKRSLSHKYGHRTGSFYVPYRRWRVSCRIAALFSPGWIISPKRTCFALPIKPLEYNEILNSRFALEIQAEVDCCRQWTWSINGVSWMTLLYQCLREWFFRGYATPVDLMSFRLSFGQLSLPRINARLLRLLHFAGTWCFRILHSQ